jgi:hypothetical protein
MSLLTGCRIEAAPERSGGTAKSRNISRHLHLSPQPQKIKITKSKNQEPILKPQPVAIILPA